MYDPLNPDPNNPFNTDPLGLNNGMDTGLPNFGDDPLNPLHSSQPAHTDFSPASDLINNDHSQHLHLASSSDGGVYTYINDLGDVYLHKKDDTDACVGRVHDQKFYAYPYDSLDYVGCMGTDWSIYDSHGDRVGYVDNNMDVHKPNGEVVYHANTALSGAAYMLFGGMGGRP